MFEKFKDVSEPISEIDITQLSEAGKEAIRNRNIYLRFNKYHYLKSIIDAISK